MGCCLGEDANLAAAQLAQKLFFRPRGRWPPRGRWRYAMVVGALVPPDATRVATSGATVYTSAPKQSREAVFANLCTLLRPLTCPQRRNSVHKCPKTNPRGQFCRSVYTLASPPGGDAPPRRQGSDVTTHPHELTKPHIVPHFWLLHYDQGPLLPIARGAGPVSDSIKGRSLVAVSLVWRSAYLV